MSVIREKTAAYDALQVALKQLDGKVAKVGWFEGARYDDKNSTPVAYVAAIQEFGYQPKNIPARPFMRPTVIAQQNTWKKIAEYGAKQVLLGNQTIGDVLENLGLKAAGDVKKTISKIVTPALSQRTIDARLARRSDKTTLGLLTKPLIDTGHMLATLTNIVEDT